MNWMQNPIVELPVNIVSLLSNLYFTIKEPEFDRQRAVDMVKQAGTMAADLVAIVDSSNPEYQQDYRQEMARTTGRCGPFTLPWLLGF